MNQINFLSEQYLREQARRSSIVREAILIVLVIVVMACWGLLAFKRGGELSRQLAARQQEAQMLQVQTGQISQLSAQAAQLRQQLQLRRELALSIDYSTVVANIGQVMPEALSVTKLEITAPTPTPRVAIPGAAGEKKVPRSVAAPVRSIMKIELRGLSPTDGDVATFMDKLSANAVFASVKMHYSRSTRVGDVIAREFHIDMEVPLDREYVPAGPIEEVAHAH